MEVAQSSLKKQSTRAAGLQSWYETTAQEAKAKEEAEAEEKRKKEEEEAKKRAEAEAKEKEYQEQVAKRKAEFAEKQKKAREEEVCLSASHSPTQRTRVDKIATAISLARQSACVGPEPTKVARLLPNHCTSVY